MNEYLYKTRCSLFTSDIIFAFLLFVFSIFIHPILVVLTFISLAFQVVSVIGTRVLVYEDRIEYRIGFILKTSSKTLPLNKTCAVTYSSTLLGKLFNFGDISIGSYNDFDGITLRGVKNAKMLSENLKSLIYKNTKE